jgi:uncharacterized protein YeaO (DUF488 family)
VERIPKKISSGAQKNKEQVSLLNEQMKNGVVTLVYGARDEEHNEALVLKEWLGH